MPDEKVIEKYRDAQRQFERFFGSLENAVEFYVGERYREGHGVTEEELNRWIVEGILKYIMP